MCKPIDPNWLGRILGLKPTPALPTARVGLVSTLAPGGVSLAPTLAILGRPDDGPEYVIPLPPGHTMRAPSIVHGPHIVCTHVTWQGAIACALTSPHRRTSKPRVTRWHRVWRVEEPYG